jgi:segregation and condensation protein A
VLRFPPAGGGSGPRTETHSPIQEPGLSEPTTQVENGDTATRHETDPDGFEIRLPIFEGPLDLLLHLVRANDMDIFDLPIAEVAQQYDAYLNLMRELDLDVAGEYLLMASTLAHIKSRLLVPPDPTEEGEEAEDPRAELTRQLLEFERYKQAAEGLSALESVRSLVFARPGGALPEFKGEALLEVGLFDLLQAFRQLLQGLDDEQRLAVRREKFAVADKVNWILETLERDGTCSFLDLVSRFPSLAEKIAAFLALLELIRLRLIVAFQTQPRGDIFLARPGETVDRPPSSPGTRSGSPA